MTIHILVEGASERAFFDRWLPRVLPSQNVRVHPHQGKGSLPKVWSVPPDPKARGLLDQLPAKLRGLAQALDPEADGVLVLLDADSDEPETLRENIVAVAEECAPHLRVRVSVATEETEAFYLGDLRALERAYPDADLEKARTYDPDSICGTWELFGEIIGDGGGTKVAWVEAMGPYVTARAGQSRSPSFRSMVQEVEALVPEPKAAPRSRPFRHKSKTEKRAGPRR
jgi:hypothetical protein